MKQIFIDTGAWCAIEDKRDVHHVEALLFKEEIAGTCMLVTTDYVLDEAYTLLLLNIGYKGTVDFHDKIEQMADAGILNIVHISQTLADETWKVFERFNIDKEWSFTDCSSFAVMKQLEIDEAFVFDHHFEQMHFIKRP